MEYFTLKIADNKIMIDELEYKPNALSSLGCNVRGLSQAKYKAKNDRRIQGSVSGYLGQPAT